MCIRDRSVAGDVEMHVKDVEVLGRRLIFRMYVYESRERMERESTKDRKPLNDREAEACDTGRRTTGIGN